MELTRFFTARHRRCFLSAIFCSAVLAAASAETAIPTLTRPVMDTANIVSEETQTELDGKIRELYEQTGAQVAVLTVPTLSGEDIDAFGTRVARVWQLGQKDVNNGALLTVALEERKIRIDVGYGLEGALTDTKCGIIIRRFIKPQFQEENYDAGIQNGVDAIIGVIAGDEALNAQLELYAKKDKSGTWIGFMIPLAMFAVFFTLVITDANGLGPFGIYWFKAVLTGQPFVRRKRKSSATSGSASHTALNQGDSDSGSCDYYDANESDSSDDYSGDGGDFGGGGASDGW